jgi:hypothetical protein
MRYKIWITLVVCGTLLALAPPVSDYLASYQVAQVMVERKDFSSVSLGQPLMSSEYRFGCWALGAAMIVVGIVGGWRQHGDHIDDENM